VAPKPDPARVPILVLAFNRPALLEETLRGLMRQEGAAAQAHPVFLFQDGGRERASGRVLASDRVLLHNFDLFRRLVPDGMPLPASEHLGAARNLARAERFAFEARAAQAAIFLPDDFVPGPWWLKTMQALIGLALAEPRIAMVAACGDPAATGEAQRAHPSRLIALGEACGYALTRRAWQRLAPGVSAMREEARHDAWAAAAAAEGLARLNTYACFGRHIGPQGEDRAAAATFGGATVIEDDIFRLVAPTAAELDALITGRTAPAGAKEALGRLRHLSGEARFDEAEALCVEWLAAAPAWRDERNHPAFLKELTQLALARGRLEQASALADRLAAAIAPADPCVNLLFARAYARMGAEDAAHAEWHAVLAKEPGNAEAQKALAAAPPA
jgi:hypothetical protein